MSAVLQNVANRYINGLAILYAGLEYDDDERANFAMLIVIFCIAFYGDVTICGQRTVPYDNLNSAQAILVKWGNLIAWSWATWNDQRIADVECITDLACSATAEFLRNNAGKWDASYERVVPSLCQALYTLFFYLDDELENLNIKDLVIENLSLIPPSVLTSSIRILREDSRLQIDVKMDEDSDRKQFIPFFGEALLTYVAITDSFMISGGQNIMEEATFWDLAIRILAVGCRRYDPLDLAEAWNHLRDVLLVILGGRFAKDDEALALLICPGICLALGVLIRATSPAGA
ncbi:hypothetical protein H0H87_011058 [Tephrocybe sp. NHM501043]|nr:hypothetical protein H0H87_011058 [Tephrocybe sp. NHM501043]